MSETSPTRVLFTIPNLEGGGAERVMVTILRHLDRKKVTPHLALVDATGVHLKRVPEDVPVTDLGGRGPFAFVRLLKLIWTLRPDVVFSSVTFYSTLVLFLKFLSPAGTRFMVRENSQPSIHLPGMPYGRLRELLYPLAHRKADAIVCQSEAMVADVATAGVPQKKLVHIPNPLDIDAIADAPSRPCPYEGKGRRLVTAGRLIPIKGYDKLLAAFAILCKEHDDLTLHILGEGPQGEALRAQRDELGLGDRVVFEGYQADPLPYFEHADLFIMSSRYEGFPNVTLEAMACGTPVVSFDYPGGTPVLDGINGWLVPNGDVDALAARMGEALYWLPIPEEALTSTIAHHQVEDVVVAFEKLLTAGNH